MEAMAHAGPQARDFESFARGEVPLLLRTARLLTGSPHDAEDLTQEALIKVHRHWDRVSAMESPGGYAHRTLVNEFLSGKRRRTLRTVPLENASAIGHGSDHTADVANREGLRQALMSLPGRQRTAIVLRYYLQLETPEIAAAMGIRPGTARSLLSRSVDSLRGHPYYRQGDQDGQV